MAMEPNPAEPVLETAHEPHLELLPALDEPKDGEEEAEEIEAEGVDDAEDAPVAVAEATQDPLKL
jgi:hypothetical protein